MVWGLTDHFVGEVVAFFPTREQAERALRRVLRDEPDWTGMIEVVPVPLAGARHWRPKGRAVLRPCCRRVVSRF
jgi:hypothetical protein